MAIGTTRAYQLDVKLKIQILKKLKICHIWHKFVISIEIYYD